MAAVAALHGSYKHNSQSSVLGPFFFPSLLPLNFLILDSDQ